MDARKIKKMVDDRFYQMLREFVGNWPFGKEPMPTVSTAISKSGRKKLVSKWKSYLKGLDARMVTEKAMERAVRHPRNDVHLRDPATDWRNSPFGGTPAYIRIPEELALRILVLGDLP